MKSQCPKCLCTNTEEINMGSWTDGDYYYQSMECLDCDILFTQVFVWSRNEVDEG